MSGKVTVDGDPGAGVLVRVFPKDPGTEISTRPQATTADDGSFALEVFPLGDAAAPGEYLLVFSRQETDGQDRLNERYNRTNSPVSFKVEGQPVDLGTITLTTQ